MQQELLSLISLRCTLEIVENQQSLCCPPGVQCGAARDEQRDGEKGAGGSSGDPWGGGAALSVRGGSVAEVISWILAIVICIVLLLALGYYDLALAGGGGLAVLWWRVKGG